MTPHDHDPTGAQDPPGSAEQALLDRYRRRLGHAPPDVTAAAAAAFRAQAQQPGWGPARVTLLLAGVAGVALDLPVLVGAAAHTSRDVAVLHLAMAVGLLVAAWRPARHAAGMAPLVAVAAVLLLLPGLAVAPDGGGMAEELSHLPIVVGAASLLLVRHDHPGPRRRHAHHPRPAR
jgi:hypothetical protein